MTDVEKYNERLQEVVSIGQSLLARGSSSIKTTINRRVAELKKELEGIKNQQDESKTTN